MTNFKSLRPAVEIYVLKQCDKSVTGDAADEP